MKTLLGIIVVLAVGTALAFSLAQETPTGRVRGRVLLPESGKSLRGVRVVLTPDTSMQFTFDADAPPQPERLRVRRTKTDEDGEFVLSQVPAGFYRVTAYSKAHHVDDQLLSVEEDETATSDLHLKRSQPDLQLAQQQRVFSSHEKAFVPVHGYLDGKAEKDVLRLRIFRARLSNILANEKSAWALQRVGDRWQPPSALPKELLHPARSQSPRLVADRRVPITGADAEGFYHQRLQLAPPGPGMYLLDVSHGKRRVCAWVQISDTGLVIKRSHHELLAQTVDMQSGAPRGGSRVLLYQDGKTFSSGKTDARGLVRLKLPDTEGNSRLMAVAVRGNDEDAVNNYSYDEEDDGDFTTHTYTDRTIYRPGDRIQYKTIIRRALERGARYTVPVGQSVEVELRDPSGTRVLRETRIVNNFGSINGAANLSKEAVSGAYTFVTTIDGEEHTQDIKIAAYRKPEYSVTVTPEQKRYNIGDKATMIVSGEYYFGAPVAGAKVRYEVFRETDWAAEYPDDYGYDEWDEEAGEGEYDYGGYGETVAQGEAQLDETGKASVTFPTRLPDEKNDEEMPQVQIFKMHVTVADAAQREVEADGATRVTTGDFRLLISPDGYVATPGQPERITLLAKDYDEKPVSQRAIELESGYWQWNEEKEKSEFKPIGTRRVVTDAHGKAIVKLVLPQSGEVRLNAKAQDESGRVVRARSYLWAAGGDGDYATDYPDLAVLTDKRHYEAGETARVLINSNRTGQSALVTIEGARIYRAFIVPLRQKSTFVSVPVLADYGPNVFLAACYVRDKKFARSEIPLRSCAAARDQSRD